MPAGKPLATNPVPVAVEVPVPVPQPESIILQTVRCNYPRLANPPEAIGESLFHFLYGQPHMV